MPSWIKDCITKEKYRKIRNAQRKRNYGKSRLHAYNSKLHWSDKETNILKTFNGTDKDLSILLLRSVQAIQIKRHKMEFHKIIDMG